MNDQLKELFPEDGVGYQRFLKKEKSKFEKVYNCLRVPYLTPFHILRPMFLKALPKLDLTQSLYNKLASYFKNEDLRVAMTFLSKYLGMSPWNCPGAFTMIPYIEHTTGIHHPIGGLNKISAAMAKIIHEEGGLKTIIAYTFIKGSFDLPRHCNPYGYLDCAT